MIRSIYLKNFQSHKETELELSPRVNVIVGPSDSGKTSILRGLRWVLHNRPSGKGFRSHWGGDTVVGIETEDAHITRERGGKSKKGNKYTLDDLEFKAMGTNVPEGILEVLNMDAVNVQNQHDRHFLLSESPAEVARTLNQAVQLEVIDDAMSSIHSMHRSASATLKTANENREATETQLEKYGGLDEIAGRVDAALLLSGAQKRTRKEILDINGHLIVLDKVLSEKESWEPLTEMEIEPILEKHIVMKHLEHEIYLMEGIIPHLKKVRVESSAAREMASLIKDLSKIELKMMQLVELQRVAGEMEQEIRTLTYLEVDREILQDGLGKLEEEYHELMPDECPLCGEVKK